MEYKKDCIVIKKYWLLSNLLSLESIQMEMLIAALEQLILMLYFRSRIKG
jgi:hypothetical protein